MTAWKSAAKEQKIRDVSTQKITEFFVYSTSMLFIANHFWTLVLRRNGRKQKFTNEDTEQGTLRNGFAGL